MIINPSIFSKGPNPGNLLLVIFQTPIVYLNIDEFYQGKISSDTVGVLKYWTSNYILYILWIFVITLSLLSAGTQVMKFFLLHRHCSSGV